MKTPTVAALMPVVLFFIGFVHLIVTHPGRSDYLPEIVFTAAALLSWQIYASYIGIMNRIDKNGK